MDRRRPGRSLPPLNGLRAFEAAGRHLSFTRAADELCVSPSAIGHQVRKLEQVLGTKLFARQSGRIELTSTGRSYLKGLREGFQLLSSATDALYVKAEQPQLTVSASPSFAVKWLAPRMAGFKEHHPDVDLRLDVSTRFADFETHDVDVDIRYGSGNYDGLYAETLFAESLFPVCAAAYTAGRPTPWDPRELVGHRLLQVIDWASRGGIWPAWQLWLEAAGVTGIDGSRGPRFAEVDDAVAAAAEGEGIALAAERHLAAPGSPPRLVRPFEASRSVRFSYSLVTTQELRATPPVASFFDWILEEAGNSDDTVLHRGPL